MDNISGRMRTELFVWGCKERAIPVLIERRDRKLVRLTNHLCITCRMRAFASRSPFPRFDAAPD